MGKYPNHMKIAVAGTGYVGLSIATFSPPRLTVRKPTARLSS